MIQRHRTYASYCATREYQQWLTNWQAPTHTQVDVWHDSQVEMWDLKRQTWDKDVANQVTPRQHARQRHATRLAHHLLDTLAIRERCVDIGCGDNWFKQAHPEIWGVDPYCEQDRDEQLTPEWWIHNWGQWPHAFSCNAVHFCDQTEIVQQIAKVRGILRPAGTGLITLNRARIAERTADYDPELLCTTLGQTPGLTRMVWFDQPLDANMDGNVWLWLKA